MNPKDKSLSVLIKEADSVFSEYVRIRDAEPFTGIVTCFITGEKAHWKKCDAAHYFGRANLLTRWNEMNVHATTIESNRFDILHHSQYLKKMMSVYSREDVFSLAAQAMSLMKPTRSDIVEIIEKYSEKVKELRKQKHI
jgi:hypothetical protein